MPRIPRVNLETNFFHIMTQGLNKSYIFDDPTDIKYYHAKEYPYSNYKSISNTTVEEYIFMDTKEDVGETCKREIKEFLKKNEIELRELKDDNNKLRKLIILLKRKYNISLRKIAEEIDINREKVRQIYIGTESNEIKIVKENCPD